MRKLYFIVLVASAACEVGDGTVGDGTSDSNDPTAPSVESIGDYVLTPAGYYHKDCVFDVGDNATFNDDETVTLEDGSILAIPACGHPRFATAEALAAGTGGDPVDPNAGIDLGGPDSALPDDPKVNGWVEDGNKFAGAWYRKMTATWRVPRQPSAHAGQLVYFFPGMEPIPVNTIVQPVLQWGVSPAGGGAFWGIASWDCNSSCPHSSLKRVNVGDTIQGTMTASHCNSVGACTWSITTHDLTNGASTTLVRSANRAMKWAAVALEAYGITGCNEYPAQSSLTMNVSVIRNDGVASSTAWSASAPSHIPACHYGVTSVGAGQVTLHWTP
jgi:hypothetical protein